jgi:hypothetical protein
MKDLGKTRIMSINVYADRLMLSYSIARVHRWNIEFVQYENNKSGSCCMEEVGARINYFDTWWVKPQEWFYQSCIPWYLYPDMYDALQGYEHSYDDLWIIVKYILMYFRRTKNIFCMQKWQMVHCNVLHWLCHTYR